MPKDSEAGMHPNMTLAWCFLPPNKAANIIACTFYSARLTQLFCYANFCEGALLWCSARVTGWLKITFDFKLLLHTQKETCDVQNMTTKRADTHSWKELQKCMRCDKGPAYWAIEEARVADHFRRLYFQLLLITSVLCVGRHVKGNVARRVKK